MVFAAFLTAAILASTSIVSAIPFDARAEPTGPFKGVVIAPSEAHNINGNYIGGKDGRIIIAGSRAGVDVGSASSCGDVPITLSGGNGQEGQDSYVTIYAADTSSVQKLYIDISASGGGVLSYTAPGQDHAAAAVIDDEFSRKHTTADELLWADRLWYACPQAPGVELYWVYAEAEFELGSTDGCYEIGIRTDSVEQPETCVFH